MNDEYEYQCSQGSEFKDYVRCRKYMNLQGAVEASRETVEAGGALCGCSNACFDNNCSGDSKFIRKDT